MGLMLTKAVVPEKSASARALAKAVDIAIQPAIKAFKCGDTLSVKGRNKVFKEQLVERDMRISCGVVEVRCSITGLLLPSHLVVAAHIFPLRAEEYVNGFCPDLVDINSVENGLLWAEVIELAFENSALMFDWNEDMKILTPYVLDRNILQTNMDVARKYLMQQCGYSKKGSDDISIVSSLFSTSSPSGEGTSMPEVVPYTMEQITNIVEGVEPSQRTKTYKLFA